MRCQCIVSPLVILKVMLKYDFFVFILKGFISIKPFSSSFKLPDQVTHSSEILYTLISLCLFTSYSPLNTF